MSRNQKRSPRGQQERSRRGRGRPDAEPSGRRATTTTAKQKRPTSLIDAAVFDSPADETEIVCWRTVRQRATHGVESTRVDERVENVAMVRVREGSRVGTFRIDDPDPGTLQSAVRAALAHAHGEPPRRLPPLPGPTEGEEPGEVSIWDQGLAELDRPAGSALLAEQSQGGEAAILEWGRGSWSISNSRGMRRRTRATAATIQIRCGRGPTAGFVTQSARSLERLDVAGAFARARLRKAKGHGESELRLDGPTPVLLSPEATIELVDQLNLYALSGRAYREGTSFLREHMGVQVFDRRLDLRDDATDASGLAFPWDFEGRLKRTLTLIEKGVPRTPTLDTWTAHELGLEPTGHSVGGEEAYGLHLFMAPGELSADELLAETEGGLWFGRVEDIEVFDPGRMRFRAHCRGVRRIREGIIDAAVPELIWEDSLLRVFSSFLGLGEDVVLRASGDGLLGGTSAPAAAVADVSELRLADC